MNQQSRIDNYNDLMKEYMKHASLNGYHPNIDYNSPIKEIEPLPPLDNLNVVAPQKEIYNNYSNDYMREKEREKELQRKKQLEYQEELNRQLEEKKRRKELEKQKKMQEDMIYEQKYMEYIKSKENEQKMNLQQSRPFTTENVNRINMPIPTTNYNSNNINTSKEELMKELYQSHPGIERILNKINNNAQYNEPPIEQMNQPQIQEQPPQYENNNYYSPITNQNDMVSNYSYSNINMPNVALSTPNINMRQLNNPFNNNLSGHNFCQPKPMTSMTPQMNLMQQQPQMDVSNPNMLHNINSQLYPNIIEKMLDFFFQEQVKIMKEYKETIEQLKSERDEAIYMNKANEEKIQVLEKIRRDQDKFEHQIGFSPFDQKYKKNLENTINSMIDREEPRDNYLNYKSKYENINPYQNHSKNIKEDTDESTLGKQSLIASTKYVKPTGGNNQKLFETWIKEEEEQPNIVIQDKKNEINDISLIKKNPIDDKSFSNDLENSFHIETNDNNNVCYPKVYQDNTDDETDEVKIIKEVPVNKDNNVKYEEEKKEEDVFKVENVDDFSNDNKTPIKENKDVTSDEEDEQSIEEKIETDNNKEQNVKENILNQKEEEINKPQNIDNNIDNKIEGEDDEIPEDIPSNQGNNTNQPPQSNNSTINSKLVLIPRETSILDDSYHKNPFSLAPSLKKSISKQSNIEDSISSKEKNSELINKMTFFDDDSNKLEPTNKAMTHDFGSFKYNPQNRYPREVTPNNIKNINNIYEKFKKKKISTTIDSNRKNSTDEHDKSMSSMSKYNTSNINSDVLLNESLNTFTNNLNINGTSSITHNTSVNLVGKEDEVIMQKVNKLTQVALDEIGQSQLSVFNKEKTIPTNVNNNSNN